MQRRALLVNPAAPVYYGTMAEAKLDPRKVRHALNPRWHGPLCRYRDGVVEQNLSRGYACQRFIITKDLDRVTCGQCLQRLGLRPKRIMPGWKPRYKSAE